METPYQIWIKDLSNFDAKTAFSNIFYLGGLWKKVYNAVSIDKMLPLKGLSAIFHVYLYNYYIRLLIWSHTWHT